MARPQTQFEERWNALTHGTMAVLILMALPVVVLSILINGGPVAPIRSVLTAIFCFCLILMFSSSALYHRLPQESHFKLLFKRLDHIAIFFAIAGSYTPIAILVIGDRLGTLLLIVEWSLLLLGVAIKLLVRNQGRLMEVLFVSLYLAMGWGVAVIFPKLSDNAQPAFFWLIVAGGLSYTIGVAFFASKRKYAHVVWHFFVNIGAICHFLAIVFFI